MWWSPPISAGHCPLRYEDPTPLIVSREPVRRNVDVAGLDRIGFGRSTENGNIPYLHFVFKKKKIHCIQKIHVNKLS